ncbi:MAG TPA: TIGR03084 family metal-binding protein, partial [Desulfosalsimonadaceae bacterium]|nr:TIGR03084 family metal-binding protein [Desulfosalsimonadaceae bacterium]
ETLCSDLQAEHAELEAVLADLDAARWEFRTPFLDWRIKDEIRHLAYFDDRAALAATNPEAFNAHLQEVMDDFAAFERWLEQVGLDMSPGELMSWWRSKRKTMLDVLAGCDPKDRLPWYGPPMSAISFTTARLMETWAHGQDIFDTLRIRRKPTDRLAHIAHLGVRTFDWTYKNRGLEVPRTRVRVVLTAPSGKTWAWGPQDAENSISGPAEDFCLVVVQRRHVDDTSLTVAGDTARDWMLKAQCFAGPPVDGPKPEERLVFPGKRA